MEDDINIVKVGGGGTARLDYLNKVDIIEGVR